MTPTETAFAQGDTFIASNKHQLKKLIKGPEMLIHK
jgi:hypothetical protein